MEFAITSIKTTTQPVVSFDGYDTLYKQVGEMVDTMKTIEVTEDTLQTNKKLVATVRKNFDELDKQRKSLKKELLTPYEEIDTKTKALKQLIDEGDNAIRKQIRELEDKQRKLKADEVKQEIGEFLKDYHMPDWLTIDNVYKNEWSNKSTPRKKITEMIVNTLDNIKSDITYIRESDLNQSEKSEVINIYRNNGLRVIAAMNIFNAHKKEVEKITVSENELDEEIQVVVTNQKPAVSEPVKEIHKIIVFNQSDLNELIKHCITKNIDFES